MPIVKFIDTGCLILGKVVERNKGKQVRKFETTVAIYY